VFLPDAVNSATGAKKWLFELRMPSNSGTNVLESIRYWKETLLGTLLSDFAAIGSGLSTDQRHAETRVGEIKRDMAMVCLQAIADSFAATVRSQVFRRVLVANGGEQAGKRVPYLVCEDLDAMPIKELSDSLQKLAAARMVSPNDPLEEYVREKMHLPQRASATR
jgi:hypothetical protein